MDAIQVSEASMASMFRRAADAIVNESSLKREVDTLTMETQINTRTIETLSAEKGKLNDFVSELQRQLTDAKYEIEGHKRDKADLHAVNSKHEDDIETLKTLLNETEQARDRALQEAKEYEANWTQAEKDLKEAQQKLFTIEKALGIHDPVPTPAPEVAATAPFQSDNTLTGALTPYGEEPRRSSDTTAHAEDSPQVPQEPIEPLHLVPPHVDESRNAWSDWMNE